MSPKFPQSFLFQPSENFSLSPFLNSVLLESFLREHIVTTTSGDMKIEPHPAMVGSFRCARIELFKYVFVLSGFSSHVMFANYCFACLDQNSDTPFEFI